MSSLTRVLLIGLILVFVTARIGASERSLVVLVPLQNGLTANLSFDLNLDDSGSKWAREPDSAALSNGTYRIELTESPDGNRSIVRARIVRLDGEAFELGGFAV